MKSMKTSACNFTKSNTPPWVFFTFFKLCEWYQIAQSTTIYHLVVHVFMAIPRHHEYCIRNKSFPLRISSSIYIISFRVQLLFLNNRSPFLNLFELVSFAFISRAKVPKYMNAVSFKFHPK